MSHCQRRKFDPKQQLFNRNFRKEQNVNKWKIEKKARN